MKININFTWLAKHAISFLLTATFMIPASAQPVVLAAAAGQPPLSQEMISQYLSVYEYLLQIKLDQQQKARLQQGLIQYWEKNNTEAMEQVAGDIEYFGKIDELQLLRNSSESIIVEAFRRDANDLVSQLFIEAYDAAHPGSLVLTRAKGFTDLVGTWKRKDGLLAEKTYSGQQAGVSYTESETVEIFADGKFKHIKVHSHYSGNCSQVEGKTEFGKVSVEGVKLIFEIQSGSEVVKGACNIVFNQRKKIRPHKERFPWVIKTNSGNNNVQTLCWNTSNTTAICFEKQ